MSAPATRRAVDFDLMLVEGVIREGLTATAAALGVDRDAALERWRELLPEPGLDAQTRLLAQVRRAADD